MKQTASGADAFAPFQKALSEGWGKAIESFQAIGAGKTTGGPQWDVPKFSFSADKLQQLQKDYLAEAAALWQQGLSPRRPPTSALPAMPGAATPSLRSRPRCTC